MDLAMFAAGWLLAILSTSLGIWAGKRFRLADPAKLTFHRPREGVLVVEVRQDLSAKYAEHLRAWLEQVEGQGTSVLVVALGDRGP